VSDDSHDLRTLSYLDRLPFISTSADRLQPTDLHTGTLNCPMSFEIQLEPSDWKKFAKQGLRMEVFGGGQNKTSFISLLNAMEMRQRRWHADKSMHTEERTKMFGSHEHCASNGESATCIRMVNQINKMVEAMEWS
jgi:hypothetical protein